MTRKKWAIALGAVVLLGGGATGAWLLWAGPKDPGLGPTAQVTRGPLPVLVSERGEVEAEKRKSISSEIEYGQVVIKYCIPDGTMVEPNQVVLELECRELDEALTRQTTQVQNLRTGTETAKKNLLLKKEEMAEKVRKAVEALTGAGEDLNRYRQGEWPVKRDEANSAVVMAQQDLRLAQDKLDFKWKVNEELKEDSPYSEKEIEAEKLGVSRLELALVSARNKYEMLVRYDDPKELRKLDGALRDANLGLRRAELEQEVQVGLAQQEIDQKTQELAMQTSFLDRLQKMFDGKVIRADGPGLVIYDTRRWWEPKTMSPGERVNSRESLLLIPNMDTLRVKTRVLEAVYEQVRKGQRALVRLDARPDLVLTGAVDQVASMPSQADRWLSPDVKSFEVFVKLDEIPPGIKPNMTARVEIILAELQDVLRVPVAAVFTEQDQTCCWRLASTTAQKVQVRVGQMNDTMVEIVSGLAEGDTVLLSPPKGSAPGGGVRLQSTPAPTTRKAPRATSAPASMPASGPATAPASDPAATRPAGRRDLFTAPAAEGGAASQPAGGGATQPAPRPDA